MAQTLSKFDDGQKWTIERVIELNNLFIELHIAVEATKPIVESFKNKKEHMSQNKALFLATLGGAVSTFVAEYLVSLLRH